MVLYWILCVLVFVLAPDLLTCFHVSILVIDWFLLSSLFYFKLKLNLVKEHDGLNVPSSQLSSHCLCFKHSQSQGDIYRDNLERTQWPDIKPNKFHSHKINNCPSPASCQPRSWVVCVYFDVCCLSVCPFRQVNTPHLLPVTQLSRKDQVTQESFLFLRNDLCWTNQETYSCQVEQVIGAARLSVSQTAASSLERTVSH